MVQILRDRIWSLVEEGMTLREVMATQPALDYDPRYDADDGGDGEWSSAMFVGAIYEDLSQRNDRE
jgi:hypothetical protein